MIIFALISLIFSFCVSFLVFYLKKINLVSNYMVYVLFSIFYSVFPLLTFYGIEPKTWFIHYKLNESELLISTQIIIMSICNIIFAYVYFVRYRNSEVSLTQDIRITKDSFTNLIFGLYIFCCFILLCFGYRYSYTSGRTEIVHSLISNGKTILASIYIFFIVRYGFNYRTVIMFFSFIALLVVEHSRWYFVSVLVATAFYLQNTGRVSNKQIILIASLFFVLLSYVGLYRSNVALTDIMLLLNPFYIEGDYGSYMILQTYDLVFEGYVSFFTFFTDYIFDPIVYLIPRIFFISLGVDKDSIGIFKYFVSSHQQYLLEQYAPVGGFHYIAQSSSALPFLGPLIVTYFFARLTVRVENSLNKSRLHVLGYYLYSSGFMFVFIKTIFDQTIKYYATIAIPAYILFFVLRRRNEKKMYY